MSSRKNRLNIGTCLLQATLTVVLLFLAVQDVQAGDKAEAFIVTQHHSDLGNIQVYLQKDAVRMDLDKIGCSLLSKAPDWRLYYFRRVEKTLWIGTPEQLSLGGLGNPYSRTTPLSKLPIVVLKPGERESRRQVCQVVELLGAGEYAGLHYEEYSAMLPAGRHKVFRVTRDIKVSPHCAQVMCRLYGLPEMNLVPLYVRENSLNAELYSTEHEKSRTLPYFPSHIIPRDLRSGPRTMIQTAAAHRATVAESVFCEPVGYARKKDILDVTYSREAKEELTKVIDSVGYVGGSKDERDTSSHSPRKRLP
jgi:hypothetical protein